MRKWLQPIKFGVLLGVVSGGIELLRTWSCAYYWSNHLYNRGLMLLVSGLDTSVIKWAILTLAVYVLIGMCVRFGDKYRVSAILIPAVVLYVRFAGVSSDIFGRLWLRFCNFSMALDKTLLEDVQSGVARIVAAILVLILGLWLLKGLRTQKSEGQVGFLAKVGVSIQRGVSRLAGICLMLNRAVIPILILLLIANVASVSIRTSRSHSSRPKPNVIFIMIDTLRADHVGCYGYSQNTTPNIDRFARNSLRFEHAVAQAPLTEWSVPSFLASRYPQGEVYQHPSLQEFLADQGYATGGILSNPLISGFGSTTEVHSAFDYWRYIKETDKSTGGKAPMVTAAALDWLDTVKSKRFFLFTLFMDAHSPYRKYKKHDFDPENDGKLPDIVQVGIPNNDPSEPAPCDVDHMKAVYDSGIAYTDEYIGRLLDKLKRDGLYDNSLIVILADHGEEFRDHGAFFHTHTLYNELLSVPLAIKLPGQTRGSVVKGYFSLIDLFPSIVSALGRDTSPMKLQGDVIRFARLKQMPDKYIFSANDKKRSIRNSDYKLVMTLAAPEKPEKLELYNEIADPHEQHDLAAKLPKLTANLRSLLLDHDKAVGTETGARKESLAPENIDRQALKTLGYVAR